MVGDLGMGLHCGNVQQRERERRRERDRKSGREGERGKLRGHKGKGKNEG